MANNSSSANAFSDDSSVYYLVANENPTLVLTKDKFEFVNGSIPQPAAEDPQYKKCRRCNTMVATWICHVIEPSIAVSLTSFNNVAAVWDDLRECFGTMDVIRIAELQEDISNLKQGALSAKLPRRCVSMIGWTGGGRRTKHFVSSRGFCEAFGSWRHLPKSALSVIHTTSVPISDTS